MRRSGTDDSNRRRVRPPRINVAERDREDRRWGDGQRQRTANSLGLEPRKSGTKRKEIHGEGGERQEPVAKYKSVGLREGDLSFAARGGSRSNGNKLGASRNFESFLSCARNFAFRFGDWPATRASPDKRRETSKRDRGNRVAGSVNSEPIRTCRNRAVFYFRPPAEMGKRACACAG